MGKPLIEIKLMQYYTSECWPGFNRLPHSSHRKQPGCQTFPREFLCSAAKYHTNTSQGKIFPSEDRRVKGNLSSVPVPAIDSRRIKIDHAFLLHRKHYFSNYVRYFVFKLLNLPKYTNLPHLWHSVIAFCR